ncbi:hypothetical protein [Candidatus Nitrospira salsa]
MKTLSNLLHHYLRSAVVMILFGLAFLLHSWKQFRLGRDSSDA